MSGLKYWVLDLESNGLDSKSHEVNEVSLIKCDDRQQLTAFIKCDYPERSNLDALRITNKTLADLQQGQSREEVVSRIDKFLSEDGATPESRCIVGHNISFDRRFIHVLYDKVGKTFPASLWLCTMALTKAYAKKIGLVKPKVNLSAACDIVGIKKYAGAHASKVDTRNTYLLWKSLVEDKQMDYLPFIKNIPHHLNPIADGEGLDPDLLDIE